MQMVIYGLAPNTQYLQKIISDFELRVAKPTISLFDA
jgi:hypothetical protein